MERDHKEKGRQPDEDWGRAAPGNAGGRRQALDPAGRGAALAEAEARARAKPRGAGAGARVAVAGADLADVAAVVAGGTCSTPRA